MTQKIRPLPRLIRLSRLRAMMTCPSVTTVTVLSRSRTRTTHRNNTDWIPLLHRRLTCAVKAKVLTPLWKFGVLALFFFAPTLEAAHRG